MTTLPKGQEGMSSMILQQNNPGSENYLSVNLWTKPQTGDKGKAIPVWMYGGGLTLGRQIRRFTMALICRGRGCGPCHIQLPA